MGYLVFRAVDGHPEIYGLLESESKARDNIRILERNGQEWEMCPVPFLGWGFEGVFTNNTGEIVRGGSALQ